MLRPPTRLTSRACLRHASQRAEAQLAARTHEVEALKEELDATRHALKEAHAEIGRLRQGSPPAGTPPTRGTPAARSVPPPRTGAYTRAPSPPRPATSEAPQPAARPPEGQPAAHVSDSPPPPPPPPPPPRAPPPPREPRRTPHTAATPRGASYDELAPRPAEPPATEATPRDASSAVQRAQPPSAATSTATPHEPPRSRVAALRREAREKPAEDYDSELEAVFASAPVAAPVASAAIVPPSPAKAVASAPTPPSAAPTSHRASAVGSSKAMGKQRVPVAAEEDDDTPSAAELARRLEETDDEIVARLMRGFDAGSSTDLP